MMSCYEISVVIGMRRRWWPILKAPPPEWGFHHGQLRVCQRVESALIHRDGYRQSAEVLS